MRAIRIICLLFLLSQAAGAQRPSASPSAQPTPIIDSTATPVPSATPNDQNAQPQNGFIPTSVSKPSVHLFNSPLTRRPLFAVAGSGEYSAEERAHLISRRLEKLLESYTSGGQPSVTAEARDQDFIIEVDGRLLVTVLPEDAAALNPEQTITRELMLDTTEVWRTKLEKDIKEGLEIRSPYYAWRAVGVLGVLFLVALFLHYKLGSPIARKTAVPTLLLKLSLWSFYLVIALWSFPQSRQWAIALYKTTFRPLLWAIAIILGTSLLIHLFEQFVGKYFESLLKHHDSRISRRFRQLVTLRQVIAVSGRVLLIILALAIFLATLPIDYTPILASASVIGVALGFAGQDILKDLFSGTSILVEDRFGVGDWISWNGHSGEVEGFNLKSTRLRTTDGTLLIIPNSELRVVGNLSNEWSQVDFQVGISYSDDFERALECLLEESEILAKEWPDKIIAPPELKGLEKLDESSLNLRLFLKTKPLEQWNVNREMNARIKKRFDAEGITIPFPQRTLWVKNEATKDE